MYVCRNIFENAESKHVMDKTRDDCQMWWRVRGTEMHLAGNMDSQYHYTRFEGMTVSPLPKVTEECKTSTPRPHYILHGPCSEQMHHCVVWELQRPILQLPAVNS